MGLNVEKALNRGEDKVSFFQPAEFLPMRTVREYRLHVALYGPVDDFMDNIQELNGTVEGTSNVVISAQGVAFEITGLWCIS